MLAMNRNILLLTTNILIIMSIMDIAKRSTDMAPGPDLRAWVRAGFIAHGTSLAAWCKDHGVLRENAYRALNGCYDGPKARLMRARLIEAAWPKEPRA
jgi:hypothetical protein